MKFVIINSILYKVKKSIYNQFVAIGTDRIDSDDEDIDNLMHYIQENCKIEQVQIPVYMS